MNCCSGCQQEHDWLSNYGLSGLAGIPSAQAAALDKYVLAGSVIEWGGKILWQDDDSSISWHEDSQERIKNALWSHGGFSMVDAGNIGSFRSPYVSIVVTTRTDFAQLADVKATIDGAVWQAGYRPDAQNFWVKSTPASARNRPDVAQPNAGAGQSAPNPDGGRSFCETYPFLCPDPDAPDENFLDKLAGLLGVSPSEAGVVGVVVALATIFIIKKAL